MPAKTALRGCRHDRPQTSGRACRPSNRSETNKRQQGRTCAEGTTPWEDGVKGVCPPDRPATRRQAGSTDIAPGCMGRCKQYGDARWGNEGCADSGRGAGGGGGTLQLLLPQQSALPMPVQPEYFDVPVAEKPSSGPAPPPPVMPPSPPSLPADSCSSRGVSVHVWWVAKCKKKGVDQFVGAGCMPCAEFGRVLPNSCCF